MKLGNQVQAMVLRPARIILKDERKVSSFLGKSFFYCMILFEAVLKKKGVVER